MSSSDIEPVVGTVRLVDLDPSYAYFLGRIDDFISVSDFDAVNRLCATMRDEAHVEVFHKVINKLFRRGCSDNIPELVDIAVSYRTDGFSFESNINFCCSTGNLPMLQYLCEFLAKTDHTELVKVNLENGYIFAAQHAQFEILRWFDETYPGKFAHVYPFCVSNAYRDGNKDVIMWFVDKLP